MEMNVVLLSLLTFSIGTEMFSDPKLRNARSVSEQSFEEKVEEGYRLLKGQSHVDETKNLVLQLYKMRKEIEDQLTTPEGHDPDSSDDIEDNVEMEDDQMNPKEESIEEINQKSKVAIALYQGDMVLTKEQADEILEGIKENENTRSKRQALRDKYHNATWKDGVFYSFHSNASNSTRRVFTKAVYQWQNDTCINFYENDTAPDRIVVFVGKGCWSEFGRNGGEQGLSLGYGCDTMRNALHELGHALGFHHTHSRYDRDHFVKLYSKNVEDELVPQFVKETKATNRNYNLTYDYGSIMHYGARGASKNDKPVMIPRDKKYLYTMGSPMLSFYDKLMMNMLYGCLGKCGKEPPAECENDGFPHPRNCSKCICPSGYGGRVCQRRPNGCGRNLTAAPFFLTLQSEVGKGERKIRDSFSRCHYWIEAPPGSAVEVILDSFEKHVAADGCEYAGVEIKTGSDKRRTGYRFCSKRHYGISLISTHNIVPLITYSNVGLVKTVLRYRIAPIGTTQKSETTSQPTADSRCRESNLCPKLLQWHTCYSSRFEKLIREVCPRSCGFCPTSPIS